MSFGVHKHTKHKNGLMIIQLSIWEQFHIAKSCNASSQSIKDCNQLQTDIDNITNDKISHYTSLINSSPLHTKLVLLKPIDIPIKLSIYLRNCLSMMIIKMKIFHGR